MARMSIVAIGAGAFLALLVILQIISTLGGAQKQRQFTFESVRDGLADDSTFLIGVGKADITG
jgi:hypothetical protein